MDGHECDEDALVLEKRPFGVPRFVGSGTGGDFWCCWNGSGFARAMPGQVENFRLRHELPAGREAAKAFWKSEVIREDREREKWPGVVALCRGKLRLEVAF